MKNRNSFFWDLAVYLFCIILAVAAGFSIGVQIGHDHWKKPLDSMRTKYDSLGKVVTHYKNLLAQSHETTVAEKKKYRELKPVSYTPPQLDTLLQHRYGPAEDTTLYCAPKSYTDSLVFEAKQKDQLKHVVTTLEIENTYAYNVIDSQTDQLNECDSLLVEVDDIITTQDKKIRRKNRVLKVLGIAALVELFIILTQHE